MVNKSVLDLYKAYLVNVAKKEGRPFRMPNDSSTLEERPDFKFFIVLDRMLKSKLINNNKKINKFIDFAYSKLDNFHVIDIVDNIERLSEEYKNIKEDTEVETKNKIKVAFDNLIKYVIINKIKDPIELEKGNPPEILKLWKKGELDERVLVKVYDLKKIKTKPWFRAYCGELASSYSKIEKNINNDVNISSLIEGELLRYKTIFKN
jgi:hypothetical protein